MTESITPEPIQEPVSVDDNAGSLTFDNAGLTELAAAIDTELQVDVVGALPAGNNNIGDVDVASMPTTTVQATDLDIRNLVQATDAVAVGDGTDTIDVLAAGADNVANTENQLVVAGMTYAFDGTAWDRVPNGGGTEAAALRVTVANDSTGVLSVDDNGGAITVDQATASSLNAQVVGSVAHDSGSPGNPVVSAGSAQDMDDTAPPNRVSAEADVTRFATDRDGTVFVHTHGPQIFSYHDDDVAAVTTDGTVHAAPGAGLSIYITDIVFSIGAATASSIFFEESTTKVLGPYYLEAVAGRGMSVHFQTPKKITANTALLVTNTGSISFSVDVTGFIAQG